MKRVTVKALIHTGDKQLIVRSLPFFKWGFVGGGVKKEETLEAALYREILEEICIDMRHIPAKFLYKKTYSNPLFINEVHFFTLEVSEPSTVNVRSGWEIIDHQWEDVGEKTRVTEYRNIRIS